MDAKNIIGVGDEVFHISGSQFQGGAYKLTVKDIMPDGSLFLSNGFAYNPAVCTTDFQVDGATVSDGGSSDYYKLPEDITDLQDLIEHQEMNFAMGNIFKAAWRLGKKAGNDASYDLKKIIWFAERELARIQ
ncbi:hypothetical protein [Shimia sp.]|uniref:hypothetical protein n=1 Tax=Shimia sp. TaxID=1954381 RepID=UPI003BA884F7